MPYTPFTWADGAGGGTPITAARLNTMETGIDDADTRCTSLEFRMDGLDGISDIGNAGSSRTVTAGNGNGTIKLLTLNAATCTLTINPGYATSVNCLELVLTQDATGGRLVTWPASVKWPSGTPPVLSTTAGAIDRVVLVSYNNGTTWYGDLVGKGYA